MASSPPCAPESCSSETSSFSLSERENLYINNVARFQEVGKFFSVQAASAGKSAAVCRPNFTVADAGVTAVTKAWT